MAADERVMILGEDVGPRGGVFRATDGLAAEFGDDRVLDTPLAESLDHRHRHRPGPRRAAADRRDPVRRLHPLRLRPARSARRPASTTARTATSHVPLVVRAPWGGGVHGALYHSQSIEATYAHIPGLKVVVPSTPADVAGLLREAVDDPDPVLFLEHKKTYRLIKGPVPDDAAWRVPIGRGRRRPRRATTSPSSPTACTATCAVEAAERLADEDGASVEVIDLRTISPARPRHRAGLGRAAPDGASSSTRTTSASASGAEVAAIVAEEAFYDLDAPVRRLATADVPSFPFAAPARGRAVHRHPQDRRGDALEPRRSEPLSPRRGSRGRGR